jgi:hypothetical protein
MLVSRPRGVLFMAVIALAAAACTNGNEPKNPSLTVGQIQPNTNVTSQTFAGGASGADYVLTASNLSTSFPTTLSVTFTAHGTDAAAPAAKSITADGATLLRSVTGSAPQPNEDFDAMMRRREITALTPRFDRARQWFNSRSTNVGGLSRMTIPSSVVVGDKISLNVSLDACANPDIRRGRVVAITQKAIIVADTANPIGGYTDAEYAAVGATFDTLVAPLDEANFGTAGDLDHNTHIVMFFTRAVNEMTPRGSTSVVGGFFYARDLFPTVDDPNLGAGSGCPTSNVGEMFYLMVPDPNGLVADARSKDYVSQQTIATTGHEYQHMINAYRRLYVNTQATSFETVWLNEGLSHIAEELLFYHVANLAPKQNITITALRASPTGIAAFNNYQLFNFGRYRTFLEQTLNHSPYAPNDDLETRGATWSLLRYLADHRSATDADTWTKLVNSIKSGLANMTDVFGADLMNKIRDWQVSVNADDYPLTGATIDAEFQQPSWNFRSVFGAFVNGSGQPVPPPFPVPQAALTDAAPTTLVLNGGSVGYVRFTVPANTSATISWASGGTTPPTTFVVTSFRTR